MTPIISSILTRFSQPVVAAMPKMARPFHGQVGQRFFTHPNTALFYKYCPDLLKASLESKGLLHKWAWQAKENTSDKSFAIYGKFLSTLFSDPLFLQATVNVPHENLKSAEALFHYLEKAQNARALIIMTGATDLLRSGPFTEQSKLVDELNLEMIGQHDPKKPDILGQANILRGWMCRHSKVLQAEPFSLLDSTTRLPMGVIPPEISNFRIEELALVYQDIDDVSNLTPLLPRLKLLSLFGNPIHHIPESFNTLPPDAIVHLDCEPINRIDVDVAGHSALRRCVELQRAAARIDSQKV